MTPTPIILGAGAMGAGVVGALSDYVSPDRPFGYLGSLLIALLGGLTLWRAGSVKAWKETAEARAERLEDLEGQLGELRAELAIPERIEGIVRFMAETAERQDAAAAERLRLSFDRLDRRWEDFNRAAENRSARIERLVLAALGSHTSTE